MSRRLVLVRGSVDEHNRSGLRIGCQHCAQNLELDIAGIFDGASFYFENRTDYRCDLLSRSASSLSVHFDPNGMNQIITLNVNPFWETEPKIQSGMFVPLQWISGDDLFDGPMYYTNQEGLIGSFIAPGPEAELVVDLDTADFEAFETNEAANQIQGLVFAIRRLVGHKNQFNLQLSTFSLAEAMALVLFRKAFPESEVFLVARKPFKKWPAEWKRLSQNLGIPMYETEPLEIEVTSVLATVSKWLNTADRFASFAMCLNQRSEVLPRRFFATD